VSQSAEVGADGRLQVGGGDGGVDVALAEPGAQIGAAGHPLDVRAEEHVRQEQHLLLGRQRVHDLDRVGGGAADVALGFHLGGGVDVGDHRGAGMLGLPGAQLVGVDRVGQRAAGAGVGDDHPLVRGQELGGLRHEVDPGEDDRRLRCRGGEPGERQRVPDVIGDVLDLGPLIVVRQDHRVALGGEPADLGLPLLEVGEARRGAGRARVARRHRHSCVGMVFDSKAKTTGERSMRLRDADAIGDSG
jgi:hypothetical protein